MLLQQLFNIVLFPWPSFGALCIDGNCEEFMQCDEQSGLLEAGGYTCVLTRGRTEELQCPNHFFLLAVYSQDTGAWTRSCHTDNKDNESNTRTIFLSEGLTTGANVTFNCVSDINAEGYNFWLWNHTSAPLYISVAIDSLDTEMECGMGDESSMMVTSSVNGFPRNREFKLCVLIGYGHFKVLVDDIKVFTHPAPKKYLPITKITVEEDVQIKSIHIQ